MLSLIISISLGLVAWFATRKTSLSVITGLVAAVVFYVAASLTFSHFLGSDIKNSSYWVDKGVEKSQLQKLDTPAPSDNAGYYYIKDYPTVDEDGNSLNLITFTTPDTSLTQQVAGSDEQITFHYDANESTGSYVEVQTFTNDNVWFSSIIVPVVSEKFYSFHLNSEDAIQVIQ